MEAESFDKKFDAGENVTAGLDLSKARRLIVTRQSIMKCWLSERLEQAAANKRA